MDCDDHLDAEAAKEEEVYQRVTPDQYVQNIRANIITIKRTKVCCADNSWNIGVYCYSLSVCPSVGVLSHSRSSPLRGFLPSFICSAFLFESIRPPLSLTPLPRPSIASILHTSHSWGAPTSVSLYVFIILYFCCNSCISMYMAFSMFFLSIVFDWLSLCLSCL